MLPNNARNKIIAIDGDQDLTKNYYGKPVTDENNTEPCAYLHFMATGNTKFDNIVRLPRHHRNFRKCQP